MQTDSTRALDAKVRFSNITVTAVTSFLILWSRGRRTPVGQRQKTGWQRHQNRVGKQAVAEPPCAVHLTHRAAGRNRAFGVSDPNPAGNLAAGSVGGGASRVRIDSLVLTHLGYPPDKEWNYSITHWSMPEEDKLTMSRFLEMHGGTCA